MCESKHKCKLNITYTHWYINIIEEKVNLQNYSRTEREEALRGGPSISLSSIAPSTLRGRTKIYSSSLLIEDCRKKRLGRKSWEVMVEVFHSFMGICAPHSQNGDSLPHTLCCEHSDDIAVGFAMLARLHQLASRMLDMLLPTSPDSNSLRLHLLVLILPTLTKCILYCQVQTHPNPIYYWQRRNSKRYMLPISLIE